MEPAVTPEMIERGYAMLLDAFNLDFSRSSQEELRWIVTAIYQAMEQERRAASARRRELGPSSIPLGGDPVAGATHRS
jgi:hypothetical protein